jgi:hypothetical protein
MAITFMTITCRREVREAPGFSRDWTKRQFAIAFAMCLVLGGGTALAGGDSGFCSRTAKAVFRACQNEVRDDFFIAKAICINVSDDAERAQCFADARASRRESKELCREQRTGRLDACKSLGEDRYDPDFDPALFDDNFANLTDPNRYFPLTIGNRWEYGGAESITVEVLNQTKLIAGVRCIVVRDQVTVNGDLIEDTDDWFAQNKDGTVWYCGEEVKDFESFEDDDPRRPELVSIDGSFKAGRDGDKPGIIFQASPTPGQVYLEEFSLGNAEDVTEVLSTTYAFGSNPELDQFVPEPLVERFCSGDCVVTKNFSLLEPGVFARKYYAPGIGVFLEVNPDTGEVVQLVECNFDSRCADLPTP